MFLGVIVGSGGATALSAVCTNPMHRQCLLSTLDFGIGQGVQGFQGGMGRACVPADKEGMRAFSLSVSVMFLVSQTIGTH